MIPLHDGIPARRFPVINVVLIVANFAVFLLYELPDQDAAINQASFYPCDVINACHLGIPWGVSWITAMFMHGNWHHILGNMVFLAVFGKNVEGAFGRLGYLVLYLAGGLAATVLQTAMTLQFGTAADAQSPNLGASGAIAAVLGAYIVLYPGARILAVGPSWYFAARIPAWFYLGFWILFQLFEGNCALVHPDQTGGSHVAFFAHVGGFVFGVLVAIILTSAGRITSVSTTEPKYDHRTSDRLGGTAPQSTPSAPAAPRKSTNVGCPNCGHVQAVPLSQPKFVCERCTAHLVRRTQPDTGNTTVLSSPGSLGTAPQSTISAPNPLHKSTKVKCFKCEHVQAVPLREATFGCAECGTKLKRRTQPDTGKTAALPSPGLWGVDRLFE
jgi:membrane associated rhomboid family serine protease/ribosomal protein S27E